MKIIGLIAEYNPFHNGHKYLIKKIKELYPDSLIILIISTSFCQRGEISILNKWEKTSISLDNDIDLVLELPYFFTVQSANVFAHASMQILNEFNIDTLVFGSETNDIKKLSKLANQNNYDYAQVKKYTKEGLNYPTILSKINESAATPNDILGIAYIKEIINNNYNIEPISIKRTNDYHDILSSKDIISASNIRKKFYDGIKIKKYVPLATYKYLKNRYINQDKYSELLKYSVYTSDELKRYLDVDEGLDNKIIDNIFKYDEIDEIIKSIKSKRYTYNKISRMLNHILMKLLKTDAQNIKDIEYIRILGFNSKGKKYLNKIKKSINYPIIFNYNKKYITSQYELLSTKVYSIIVSDASLIENEFKKRCIIIND